MDNIKFSYQLLDISNPVFKTFICWSSILIIKHMLMSTLTSIHRFSTKVPENYEIIIDTIVH